MRPAKIEYDLGTNMHGQPVKLVDEAGRWILSRDAANQRDDSARIELSVEQMKMIADMADWSNR